MSEQQEFLDYLSNPLRVQLAEKIEHIETLLGGYKTIKVKTITYDGITMLHLEAKDYDIYNVAEDIVVSQLQDFVKHIRCVTTDATLLGLDQHEGHAKIFYISEKGFE